jgi:hypothetical protein
MNDTIRYIDKEMTKLHREMLENTRGGERDEQKLAIAVLVTKSGDRRMAYHTCEYGDGEGERSTKEFIDDCVDNRLLQEGESLEMVVPTLALDKLERSAL